MPARNPERSVVSDASGVELDDDERNWLAEVRARSSWQLSDIAEAFCRCFVEVAPTKIASLHLVVVDWISSALTGPNDDPVAVKRRRVVDEGTTLQISLQAMAAATCALRRSLGEVVADLYQPDEVLRVTACVDSVWIALTRAASEPRSWATSRSS